MFRQSSSLSRDEILEHLRNLLEDKMEKRQSSLERFIPRGRLLDLWSISRLETFVDLLAPGFNKDSIPDVQQRYVQTLSILVWIRWKDWSKFGTIFLKQGRADCNIPTYTLPALENPSFLGRQWADSFFNAQYVFCPIDIVQGQNIERSKEWRLPFLAGGGKIGSGGFGVVIEETIARGHFRMLSDHADEEPLNYEKDLVVARKCFTTRSHFRDEVRNLSLLDASLSNHDRIVSCLATVTVGRDFNIIFPRANMDLDWFLEYGYQDVPEFTLRDLMTEAWNLAGALSFLHRGLQPPRLKCRHRDLKPSNILLFLRRDSPVGKWKISDFGISVIDQPAQGPTTITDFVNNHTYPIMDEPRYPNSTYQPPEASTNDSFGRRSDVWSFGCILMRVLAFGLGGEGELRYLDNQRALNDDGTPGNINDRFYRGSPPVLNPHVRSWLTALPARYPQYRQAAEKYADLLLGMLSIEMLDRPVAEAVHEELENILRLLPTEGSLEIASDSASRSSWSEPPSHNGITATVESLVTAIKNRSRREVEALLNGIVMVEETHDKDRPVIHAIRHNFLGAVQMLQAYRSDLDLETPDSNGSTPLKLAVETGNIHLVKLLLDAGVNIDAPSAEGLTPLMAAAKDGDVSIIEKLLSHGANPMAYSTYGYTGLHYAAISRRAGREELRPFIKKLQTVDIPAKPGGQTPFLVLIYHYTDTPRWREKFDILREAKADISKADGNEATPLSVAVRKDAVELVELLLEHHAMYGKKPIPKRPYYPDMNKLLKRIRAQNDQESTTSLGSFLRLRRRQL